MKENTQQSINVENQGNSELNGNESRMEVDGTPFWIVKLNEDQFAVTLGREILKIKGSINECKGYIALKPWELILNATAVYVGYIEESKKAEIQKEESIEE